MPPTRNKALLFEGSVVLCVTVLSATSWCVSSFWFSSPSERQWFPQVDLDLRSLAVGRMALGAVLLWDLSERMQDVDSFYGDKGCCPRHVVLSGGDPRLRPSDFSIYFAVGSNEMVKAALAIVGGISSCCLLLGYGTRKAAFACWVHWRSIETRNGVIHQAGDLLLRLLLWWAMFLPLGACWSVDSNTVFVDAHDVPCSKLAAFGLLQQMACVYYFTALFKVDPSWTGGGRVDLGRTGAGYQRMSSAIRLVLSNYGFRREPLASWLLQVASSLPSGWLPASCFDITWFLTRASWWIEICALPLLFGVVPLISLRLVAVVTFISFHVGIAMTMRIGLFPAICIAGWLLVVPSCIWDWMPTGTICSIFTSTTITSDNPSAVLPASQIRYYYIYQHGGDVVIDLAATFLIVASIALAWSSNLRCLPISEVPVVAADSSTVSTSSNTSSCWWSNKNKALWVHGSETMLWRPLTRRMSTMGLGSALEADLCRLLGQHQQWFMFDKPSRYDRWFISIGHCVDGTVMDVFGSVHEKKFLTPVLKSPPPPWRVAYRSHRWRKFFSRLLESRHHQLRQTYAEYICRAWNDNLVASLMHKKVIKFEMRCVRRTLVAVGSSNEKAEQDVSLWMCDLQNK